MELSATQLVEIADEADEDANAKIPGIPEKADEKDKAKRVGIIMAQLFKAGTEIEIDVYRITRIERQEERPEHRDFRTRKSYVFGLIAGQSYDVSQSSE